MPADTWKEGVAGHARGTRVGPVKSSSCSGDPLTREGSVHAPVQNLSAFAIILQRRVVRKLSRFESRVTSDRVSRAFIPELADSSCSIRECSISGVLDLRESAGSSSQWRSF